MSSKLAATHSDNYHACECYGHDLTIPDYQKDISVPRTLQGHYAKKGGCPCPPGRHAASCSGSQGCVCDAADKTLPKNTYRASEGPHTVHPAAAGGTTNYPNSRNYGGTVEERGATTLTTTAQLQGAARQRRAAVKKEERMQDRKNFLKAVLRDEMLARMDAEARREALELDTGLMASNHVAEYEATRGGETAVVMDDGTIGGSTRRRGIGNLPTVADQYGEVIDELRYVAGQPVGSKFNINRLYYLLEEEDRINGLRHEERIAARSKNRM